MNGRKGRGMNWQEAAEYFARKRDTLIWGLKDNRDETRQAHDAYNEAIAALCGPQPDPKTGLVPCGCEGKAHIINSSGYSRRLYVECDRCAIMLGVEATGDGALQGIYRYDDQIIKDWNHAMGMLEVEG